MAYANDFAIKTDRTRVFHFKAMFVSIDIQKRKQAVESDLRYKLRNDGEPLPVTVGAGNGRK